MTETRIDYRLPVTVVRFTGYVVEITDSLGRLGDNETTTREGSAMVDVRADPRAPCSISVSEPQLDKLKTTFKLLTDGRLVGGDAAFDSQSGPRLGAILSSAVTAGASVLPLVVAAGPAGAAAAAAAALVAGVSASHSFGAGVSYIVPPTQTLVDGFEVPVPIASLDRSKAPARPDPEELGLDPRFRTARPAEFEVLYRYRLALLRTSHAHAQIAEDAYKDPERARRTLRDLDGVLASIRAETSRVEQAYELWRTSKLSTRKTYHEEQIFVDQLPREADLRRELRESAAQQTETWWDIATTLRLMVTCDLEAQPEVHLDGDKPVKSSGDGTVYFRQPIPARLKTWRLTRRQGSRDWEGVLERTDRILVTHPAGTRSIRLPLDSRSDAKVSIGFDESGALTAFGSDWVGRGSERADALLALPGNLKGAAEAGTALGASFSPGAARAGALKQRLEELETRAKVQGLLNPAKDDLAEVRKQLAEAELEARLSLAQRVIQDPSSVIVTTGGMSRDS